MVVLAQLAVRPVPVTTAVLTLPATPGSHVKLFIEPTLCGPVITLAG